MMSVINVYGSSETVEVTSFFEYIYVLIFLDCKFFKVISIVVDSDVFFRVNN